VGPKGKAVARSHSVDMPIHQTSRPLLGSMVYFYVFCVVAIQQGA
jgi:hypothetical protein